MRTLFLFLGVLPLGLRAEGYKVSDYELQPYLSQEVLLNASGDSRVSGSGSLDTRGLQTGEQQNWDDLSFNPTYRLTQSSLAQDLDLTLISRNMFTSNHNSSREISVGNTGLNTQVINGESQRWDEDIAPLLAYAHYWGPWQAGLKGDSSMRWTQSRSHGAYQQVYEAGNGPEGEFYADWAGAILSSNLELRLGWGRLIETETAWRALELAEELQRQGLLARALEPGELQALAGQIALNNKRLTWQVRDAKRRSALALFEELKTTGALVSPSAEAVLAVYDVADYATVPRKCGAQILWLGDWHGEREDGTQSGRAVGNVYPPSYFAPMGDWTYSADALGVGLEADWSRPLAQAWQLDLLSRAEYQPYAQSLYKTEDYGWNRESVSGALTYIPSTAWSLKYSTSLKSTASRTERHAGVVRLNLILVDSEEDSLKLETENRITGTWQLSPYLWANLSIFAVWDRTNSWDQRSSDLPYGNPDLVNAFLADRQGQPRMEHWNNGINWWIDWRIL